MDFLQGGPDAVDMEQETRELPLDENNERVQEQFHGSANESDKSPPQQAQENAQAVLDIREKTDAMTDTGWNRAEMLAEGGELSESVIQKMAQFKRHQSNTEYENYSDVPESKKSGDNAWWTDKGTVAWFGWGGTAAIEWAVEQSKQITENLLAGEFEPRYFGLNFDPVKHPRDPNTGKFVERPYPVPDDISGLSTEQVIGELAATNENFGEQVEGIAVDMPGDENGTVPTEIQELIDDPDAGSGGSIDEIESISEFDEIDSGDNIRVGGRAFRVDDTEIVEEGFAGIEEPKVEGEYLDTGDRRRFTFEEGLVSTAGVAEAGETEFGDNSGTAAEIRRVVETQYGPKLKIDSPFAAKDAIKSLEFDETHRSWDSNSETWDIDVDGLDTAVEKLTSEGFNVKVSNDLLQLDETSQPNA
jgi:hypothetical protein